MQAWCTEPPTRYAAPIDAIKDDEGERKSTLYPASQAKGEVIEMGVDARDLAGPRSTLMVIGRVRP